MASKRRADAKGLGGDGLTDGIDGAPAASAATAAAAGRPDGKKANLLQLDKLPLPSGLIVPDFDLAALTVEELRKEMEMRGLDATGSKAALCERLQDLIAKGETPPSRLVSVFEQGGRGTPCPVAVCPLPPPCPPAERAAPLA